MSLGGNWQRAAARMARLLMDIHLRLHAVWCARRDSHAHATSGRATVIHSPDPRHSFYERVTRPQEDCGA